MGPPPVPVRSELYLMPESARPRSSCSGVMFFCCSESFA